MATVTNSNTPAVTSSPQPGSPALAKPASAIPTKDNLSLRLIRLSKPQFHVKPIIYHENTDAFGDIGNNNNNNYNNEFQKPFGISNMLVVPSVCGKIFIGEVFSCYITVINGSTTNVTNVSIKVTLQTPREKVTVLEILPATLPVFSPGDSQDFVVSHDITEPGIHVFVCATSYVRSDGEKKHFRKFFQFEVEQPLVESNKTHYIDTNAFIELQLKNTSVVPLYIDKVSLIPERGFQVESLNEGVTEGPTIPFNITRLNSTILKPGQIRQYLYRILDSRDKNQQAIGHWEIDWKSNTGSSGKITTALVKRALLRPKDFRLDIIELPDKIELEVPFDAKCIITNCSTQTLTPKLCAVAEKQSGIMIHGVCGSTLKQLAPGENVSVPLSFFPLFPGIQSIDGLRVLEQQFDKKFDFDRIVDVFVQSPKC